MFTMKKSLNVPREKMRRDNIRIFDSKRNKERKEDERN